MAPQALIGGSGTVLEARGMVAGFDDRAAVVEPIEERGGHLGVAEVRGHLPKARFVVRMIGLRS